MSSKKARSVLIALCLTICIITGCTISIVGAQEIDENGVTRITSGNTYDKTSFYDVNKSFEIMNDFHLVGFSSVHIQSHVDGNVMTDTLDAGGRDFGTRNVQEVTYAKHISNVQSIGDSNMKSMLVVGKDVNISTADNGNAWAIDGQKLNSPYKQSNPNGLLQEKDVPYMDLINQEWLAVSINQWLRNQKDANTTVDVADQNNQHVDYSGAQQGALAVAKLDANGDYGAYSVNVKGFDKSQVNTLVINMDLAGKTDFAMPGSIMQYTDGTQAPTGEVSEWQNGNVIWNFYDSTESDGLYRGNITSSRPITGMILAPEANVNAGGNVNGTIIANNITCTGETHRTDFTGKLPAESKTYIQKQSTRPVKGEILQPGTPDQPQEEKVKIPEVNGKTSEEAKTELEKAGLTVKITEVENDGSHEAGTVRNTNPGQGTEVVKGSEVVIFVYKEYVKTTVQVPDVSGKTLEEAKTEIEKAGLTVTITYIENDGSQTAGTVKEVKPAQLTEVEKGSVVEIFVYKEYVKTTVQVPDVSGKTLEEAKTELEKAGLTVKITYIENDGSQTAGTVKEVKPAQLTEVAKGSEVEIFVYKEYVKTTVQVPDVSGKTLEEAKTELEKAGLKVTITYIENDGSQTAGTVKEVKPAQLTEVEKGSTVEIFVYSEKKVEQVTIPQVTGYTEKEAQTRLEQLGLTVKIIYVENDGNYIAGTVEKVSPAELTKVVKSSEVTIYIYKEIEKAAVPEVTGKTVEEAKTILENAGFKVKITYVENDGNQTAGTVQKVNPAQGTEVNKGSEVEIFVYKEFVKTTVQVPDVTGKTTEEAKAELEKAGFTVTVTEVENDGSYVAGTVQKTNPEKLTEVAKNSVVEIFVYKAASVKEVTVPQLNGVTLEEAKSRLEQLGFTVNIVYVTNDGTHIANTVESTNPGELSNVKEGSTITINVYEDKVIIPDVHYQTQEQAKETLKERGFRVSRKVRKVSNVDRVHVPEMVKYSMPEATDKAEQGTEIKLYVYDERGQSGDKDLTKEEQPVLTKEDPRVQVPEVNNQTEEYAKSLIADSKLVVKEIVPVYNDGSHTAGTVAEAKPAQFTPVDENSFITLQIYDLAEADKTIKVPDVVNLTSEDAQKKITDAGLQVKVDEKTVETNEDEKVGKVASQTPKANEDVKKNDTVTITLYGKAPAKTDDDKPGDNKNQSNTNTPVKPMNINPLPSGSAKPIQRVNEAPSTKSTGISTATTTTRTKRATSPNTDDSSSLAIWGGLIGFSAALVATMSALKKRED